ncbi:hypothetical protein GGR54DRAFT_510645 [Hypoxylon sp. NC1633]|nr:hypothetical protein GGR54DRAFT_510645 [Hypoxylon sp. NC1633]
MLVSILHLAVASLQCVAASIQVSKSSNFVDSQPYTPSTDDDTTADIYNGTAKHASAVEATRTLSLVPRCGENQVTCDNRYLADRSACVSLVNDLKDSQAELPEKPRSTCGTYAGKRCCVSWHAPVKDATKGNLVGAALAVLRQCKGDTGVSGLTEGTVLGSGTCVRQCLSVVDDQC